MKRFGVQLAAGGIVILLGALGVAQAQRDSGTTESAQWDLQSTPAATPPPAPIAAVDAEPEDGAASSPSNQALGSFDFPASNASNAQTVRTVGHEEPQGATFGSPDSSGFTPPSQPAAVANDPPTSGMNFGSAPGWSLPEMPPSNAYSLPSAPGQNAPGQNAPGQTSTGQTSTGQTSAGQTSAGQQPTDPAAAPSMTLPNHDAAALPSATALATAPTAGPASPPSDAFAAMPTLPLDQSPTDNPSPANALRGSGNAVNGMQSDGLRQDADQNRLDPSNSAANGMAAAGPTQLASPIQPGTTFDANAIPLYPIDEPGPDAYVIPTGKALTAANGSEAGAAADRQFAADAGVAADARVASRSRDGLANLGIGMNGIGKNVIDADTDAAADDAVLAEPGDRRLEGIQSPSVVIHKRAPDEVKVGKPATFVIQVQNVGSVEALGVVVNDRIPAGMSLVDASPTPAVQGDLLSWTLGAIEPGGERTVTLQLVPEKEGELGSVARVTFEAAASVRTISTRPEIKITQRAPAQVLIGQQLEIELEVSNPGSGAATGVVMQEDVPEGLDHPKGRQLDNVIGTLAPGEVRRQVLRLRAVGAGQIENRIRLTGDDGLVAEDAVTVQVIAPQLAIELEGPSRRFLERQATFNVNLANVGTADATNVEIVAYLDRGFSFVGTEYQGQYDPARHAVYWSLAELPAEGRGSVPLKLLPIEQGERAIRLEAKGDLNVIAQYEKNVSVDTLAELTFSITDDADPIEVGSEATYEIRISNRGSRDDTNVKMQMQLPPGLELVSSEAEASTDGRGLIAFAPTMSLPAGGDTVHRVRVRGVAAGTHVVKTIVTSAQATVPVTKEESTMVYADK